MKINPKLFDGVAKSENLVELRRQRAAAAKDPANADFVAAIDVRVAELGAAWEAAPCPRNTGPYLTTTKELSASDFPGPARW
jgi:hypothetical protein